MVCRLTRRDHQDHLEDISCQLVGNQQIFWRWLKNVRGRSAGIPNLKNIYILTAAVDKAKVFNHYFSFCQRKHLKSALLEESLMGYMEHSISGVAKPRHTRACARATFACAQAFACRSLVFRQALTFHILHSTVHVPYLCPTNYSIRATPLHSINC